MVPSQHNSKYCSQEMLLSLYLYASIFFDDKQHKWKELTANERNKP